MYRIDKDFIGKLIELRQQRRPTQMKGLNVRAMEGRDLDEVITEYPRITSILERVFRSVTKQIPELAQERIEYLRAKNGQVEDRDNTQALDLAHLLFDSNQFDQAMSTYEPLIGQRRKDIEILTRYSISCLKTGAYQKTGKILSQILDFDPAPLAFDEDVKHELCLLAQKLTEHDVKQAKLFYEFVFTIDERFIPAMLGLGDMHRELHEMDDAKFFYKMADAHAGTSLKARLGLAHCYQATGDSTKSLHYLQACIDMQPTDADIWIEVGVISQGLSDLQKARFAFRQALTIDPTSDVALIRLSQLQEKWSIRRVALN